ncbi:DUF523 domain-containing protein [Sulfurimonas sp.]|uniref:DUF523 domain-containing protein n=1 Tax=Sulfurimonas sp. TaxID=2022749 RepID=UPI002626C3F6|nr:DUF523 domain-containing protein [Sulfurimonas sp.]MCW8895577.1 DUF523 domain-containing protein [Sulfurimonas sp.]MCW9066798.1 DUF523 domain-containing protein [Sulfurimonas sp.]
MSACLLGEYCRYDGKTKKEDEIIKAYKDYEIIPFCPEAPLFGTPRERISVVEIEGMHRIITDDSKKDVTELLEKAIKDFVKSNPHVDAIVLKSKSPSCGLGTTPVVDIKGKVLYLGNGIAAQIFQNEYTDIDIKDDKFVEKLEKVML